MIELDKVVGRFVRLGKEEKWKKWIEGIERESKGRNERERKKYTRTLFIHSVGCGFQILYKLSYSKPH